MLEHLGKYRAALKGDRVRAEDMDEDPSRIDLVKKPLKRSLGKVAELYKESMETAKREEEESLREQVKLELAKFYEWQK